MQYHIPTTPYSPIDALNRRAAAVGSPGYAMKAAKADYNGHAIRVWWNDYRRYYIADYIWAGRNVLARGSFEDCLRAAMREHGRGALGSSVTITLRDGDTEAQRICEETDSIKPGSEDDRAWYTWRHKAAASSARDSACPAALVRIFDWDLMQTAQTEQEYDEAVRAKYGRVWH